MLSEGLEALIFFVKLIEDKMYQMFQALPYFDRLDCVLNYVVFRSGVKNIGTTGIDTSVCFSCGKLTLQVQAASIPRRAQYYIYGIQCFVFYSQILQL